MAEITDFRDLPAVHEIFKDLSPALKELPRAVVMNEIRRVLDAMRSEIRSGNSSGSGQQAKHLTAAARVERALDALARPSLRTVINATGVVLHTNLGRAPLGPLTPLPGYSNLEYDLAAARRGKRDAHISGLLERLLGVPAIAVNNNAAAVFLALNELAAGGDALVSRGELIEIGDGFRIPEIMARSGAVLCECGTTNRTRIEDYRQAISERSRVLLRVHPSNFQITGFTERPPLAALAELGREYSLPVYEDLGSGCLADLRPFGIQEPLVSESLAAGADLVSFSGDKLLGGPQAGILAGKPEIIARLRRNPLFRALRLDKLICQALETTLRNLLFERWEAIPALSMIRLSADAIRERATALLARTPRLRATVVPGQSLIGGGATPEQSLPTWLIAMECANAAAAEQRLRASDPPVIARIEDGRLLLDLRTVFPGEEATLAKALEQISP